MKHKDGCVNRQSDINYVVVYLLRTHPEILVDRKNNPDPWNRVQQHQNIKVSVNGLKMTIEEKVKE